MTGYRGRRRIGTRLVGSQGRTVRGLSVRKAYQCEACRFARQNSVRLVNRFVGVSARGLSVRRAGQCEACRFAGQDGARLVSSGSKVQALVGQQYDASV